MLRVFFPPAEKEYHYNIVGQLISGTKFWYHFAVLFVRPPKPEACWNGRAGINERNLYLQRWPLSGFRTTVESTVLLSLNYPTISF